MSTNEQDVVSEFSRHSLIVSRGAIVTLLNAVNGPSHHIRELQATRGLPIGPENPINTLIAEVKEQLEIFKNISQDQKDHVLILDQLYKDISKSNELNQEAKARYLSSVKYCLTLLLNQK